MEFANLLVHYVRGPGANDVCFFCEISLMPSEARGLAVWPNSFSVMVQDVGKNYVLGVCDVGNFKNFGV